MLGVKIGIEIVNLIKSKEAAKKLGVCYETFRKVIKHQPDFPKVIKLTPKSRPMWNEDDIDNYLKQKAA